jgi:CheY-like chemotaxis protein
MLGAAIQRDEIQAALRKSDEQLRHSQKMEAIGQLASGVSHDFNNLLTAIQGYITLAKGVLPRDHPAAGSLEQVELAARQATGVANSLLAFSRRSAGEHRHATLHSVAEPAIRLLRRSLPSNISMEFRCSEAPVWVQCDPSQIQQVIVALALNAKDAMPEGGALVVDIDQVEKAGQSHARVRVTDTGVGMPVEVLRRVFEPFFTTKARSEGTGLSLAISHSIISLHQGEMEVQSLPGKGSTFTFTLPLAEVPEDLELSNRLSPQAGVALVVEDNQLVGALVSTILASLGYSPVQAGSVAEASECLHPAPSVIVVDVELPDIPGPEWVRMLRGRGVQTPVVFITGRSDTTDVSVLSPAVSLHKPFQAADLVRVLGSMVGEPSGATS